MVFIYFNWTTYVNPVVGAFILFKKFVSDVWIQQICVRKFASGLFTFVYYIYALGNEHKCYKTKQNHFFIANNSKVISRIFINKPACT